MNGDAFGMGQDLDLDIGLLVAGTNDCTLFVGNIGGRSFQDLSSSLSADSSWDRKDPNVAISAAFGTEPECRGGQAYLFQAERAFGGIPWELPVSSNGLMYQQM
jgi:hypothetical protein